MKNLIYILSILFLITSCDSDDDNGDLGTEEFFQLEINKQLTIKTNETFENLMEVNVCEGDKTVFKYTFRDLGEDGIDDSLISEFIYFQIDNDLDSFEFRDEELMDIQAIYQLSCFCDFEAINPFLIEKGTISGTKQNNDRWNISINIEDNRGEAIVVDEVFSMGNSFSICEEAEIENTIEEITFTGDPLGCGDFEVKVLKNEIEDNIVLTINGTGRLDLDITNQRTTFNLPNEKLNIDITSYDINPLQNFCDDIIEITDVEATETESWKAISGTISLRESNIDDTLIDIGFYNLDIVLENVILENDNGEQLTISELSLDDVAVGFFPG